MSNAKKAREAFRKLHQSGCFVMPNPWDEGTARYLARLGFPALATTSAGLAFSRGLPDSAAALTRETVLEHVAGIVAATSLPVNADFQDGYAADARGVAESVKLCVATGVAGLSIEDATGDPARPLHELSVAVERVRAARAAIDESESGVVLTARAECYIVGHPTPLGESLHRLEAYAAAGADVLYAPGPRRREEIAAIVSAVAPKPVNVLVSSHTGITVDELRDLGVRRISVGSSLCRAAWTAFMKAAAAIAERGSFEGFDGLVPYGELDTIFRRPSWPGGRPGDGGVVPFVRALPVTRAAALRRTGS